MRNILFIILLNFSLSLSAQEVVILRDFSKSTVVNEIINNIVSSIESHNLDDEIFVHTDKESFHLKGNNKSIAIGEKSIALFENENFNHNNSFYIGSMSPSLKAYSFAFTPSPQSVVESIKKNFPNKNHLYIVSNKRHDWLDKQYIQYCKENGLRVSFYYGSTLRVVMEHYRNILSNIKNESSLILINENSLVDNDVILPYILNKSWDNDVIVISTKASHAKYGILMSLVPDIKGFGFQINNCFKKTCNKIENIDGFNVGVPLVNKRMYNHLGLKIKTDLLFLE